MKVAPPTSSPAPKTSASEASSTTASTKVKGTRINGPKSASAEPSAAVAAASSPEISAKGKEMLKAQAAARGAPEVREERIAELKKKIAGGEYQVSAEAVADRMVDEHLAMVPRR